MPNVDRTDDLEVSAVIRFGGHARRTLKALLDRWRPATLVDLDSTETGRRRLATAAEGDWIRHDQLVEIAVFLELRLAHYRAYANDFDDIPDVVRLEYATWAIPDHEEALDLVRAAEERLSATLVG